MQPAVGAYPKAYRPGDIFKDCPECPEMVVVPAGRFRMGDLSGDGRDNEKPVHTVTIGYKLAVGKYEVSFGEWEACLTDLGCNNYRPDNRDWGRGRRPVIDVSWNDAKAYVRWLSGRTGQEYRLLSEAEWEYAARAGTRTGYNTGSSISQGQTNYGSKDGTVRVGSDSPNAFGLYDVHGNLFEWTEDCWHDSYHGAPGDGGAWTTGDECDKRVLRGGPRSSRSGISRFRRLDRSSGWHTAKFRSNSRGFRVARTF